MHPRVWIRWTGEELLDIPPEELRPLVAGVDALLRRIEKAPAEPFYGCDFAEVPGGLAFRREAGR